MLCEFLAGVTGFESLGASALTGIAERMKPRRMRVGDALVPQGEIRLELFVIRSGKVDVLVTDGRGTRKVADLRQGDFFGERALITGEPRIATVTASEDGIVYTLDKASFEAALDSSPTFREQVLAVYFQRQ
jgi:CRP-like cAMP-binding protein